MIGFIEICRKIVIEHHNSNQELRGGACGILQENEVVVLDYNKLGDSERVLMSTKAYDGIIYEFTRVDNNTVSMTVYRSVEFKKVKINYDFI